MLQVADELTDSFQAVCGTDGGDFGQNAEWAGQDVVQAILSGVEHLLHGLLRLIQLVLTFKLGEVCLDGVKLCLQLLAVVMEVVLDELVDFIAVIGNLFSFLMFQEVTLGAHQFDHHTRYVGGQHVQPTAYHMVVVLLAESVSVIHDHGHGLPVEEEVMHELVSLVPTEVVEHKGHVVLGLARRLLQQARAVKHGPGQRRLPVSQDSHQTRLSSLRVA